MMLGLLDWQRGEAGFYWSRAGSTTSTVEVTATTKSVIEAWSPWIAEHIATTESVFVESPDAAGSSWSRAGGTEGPRVGVCGVGTEGSRVGACEDGTEDHVLESSEMAPKDHQQLQSLLVKPPFVLRAVERLLDVGHEPALRCIERLRKRIVQDSFEHFVPSSE